MAGIDRLAEVMGRDNDMDSVERDNLCRYAAEYIERLKTPTEDVIYLRPIDEGTDNECWVVCNRVDPGAIPFVARGW
jgi:hypothetical protein